MYPTKLSYFVGYFYFYKVRDIKGRNNFMGMNNFLESIPELEFPGTDYDALFVEEDELQEICETERIIVEPFYKMAGYKNANSKLFTRPLVYEKLLKISELLPNDFKLKIWDAWRPFNLQVELYRGYRKGIIKDYHLENASFAEQEKVVTKFVSYPEKNEINPPVHTTGGAVDLTIVDSNNIELDMGTKFDSFEKNAVIFYYEKCQDKDALLCIRNNRRLLYNLMIQNGFTNLPSE